MTPQEKDAAALALAKTASAAGAKIMAVYAEDFAVREKADSSPVSDADEIAEAVLISGVEAAFPGVAIVAEEAVAAAGQAPKVSGDFFLIDPLDGTKEFISRNGEFTVNVALIRGGEPVIGVVYAPARGRMYVAGAGARAGDLEPGAQPDLERLNAIATRAYPASGMTAVTSRSHADEKTKAFLETIPVSETKSAGSSLKFCLVAEGVADVYPRFGRTMEWDVAAGHAVLAAAGGCVTQPDGAPFGYGKRGADPFGNGPFIAWGRACLA